MADFLTTQAKFRCICNNVFTCKESDNRLVRFGDSLVLTKGAELSPINPVYLCPVLTMRNNNTPTRCSLRFQGWTRCSPTHIINGREALTSDSTNSCRDTGMPISLLLAPDTLGRFSKGSLGFTAWDDTPRNKSAGSSDTQPAKSSGNPSNTGGKAQPVAVSGGANSREAGNKATGTVASAPGEGAAIRGLTSDKTQGGPASEETVVERVEAAYRCSTCQKRGCTHRKSEYGKSDEAKVDWGRLGTDVDNDSRMLRKNYLLYLSKTPVRTSADVAYTDSRNMWKVLREADAQKNKPWVYAAHHIISGRQVFMKFPDVVRMAHACGYDINCFENCIMLVSNQGEYGKKPADLKNVSAYETMSTARIQWHLGGHDYSFSKEEIANVEKTIKKELHIADAEIKSYMELVESDLRKINNGLDKRSICPDGFIKRMNNCAAKIRTKLAAFRERRSNSYPYYVSRVAYKFAFDLPKAGNIAVLRAVGKAVLIERFRHDQPKDEHTLRFKASFVGASADFLYEPGRSTPEHVRECICFLGNIELFVFLDMDPQYNPLPFSIEEGCRHDVLSGEQSTETILRNHAEHLKVWLRQDMEKRRYVAPMAKILERQKAAGVLQGRPAV